MERHPLVEEIKTPLTAPQCFETLAGRPFSFFLDSGMDPGRLGRYSIMGADPFLVLRSRGDEVTVIRDGAEETAVGNPFDRLGGLLEDYALDGGRAGLPFTGGVVGFFGYDLGRLIERLPSRAADDWQLPECFFGFYDAAAVFDNLDGKAYLVATGFPEREEKRRLRAAAARLGEMKSRLREGPPPLGPVRLPPAGKVSLKSNFSHRGYLRAVEAAREYILAGDIFEVNLSQRFEAGLEVPPYELYRRLRGINPAPFAAYLGFGDLAVIGASPERFLQVRGDFVETRPIKGTRPRGRTPEEDRKMARELLESAKDRAENVMIVDLERNDIGRVCRYGTVRATEVAVLETYPSVFHLTSTVVGRLSEGKGRIDLLKATFPGGSITGAPKVKAMEIIEELEPTRRGVYTGALGYLSFGGDMDLNIVIRTMVARGGRVCFQVGGAVTADSSPEAEYRETLDKGRALMEALRLSPEAVVEIEP